VVGWIAVINYLIFTMVHNIGKKDSPLLLERRGIFFLIFRILTIWEIDFWDFGYSGNQIRDIGFRILEFQIWTFGFGDFDFRDFDLQRMEFRILDCNCIQSALLLIKILSQYI